jgi:hypothetical protein
MKRLLFGIVVALVVATAACAPAESVTASIGGVVLAGPTCPVVTDPPDPACNDRPVASAVLVVRGADGREVARTISDAQGAFRVALAAGSYVIEPQPVDGLMGTAEPVEVTVEDGEDIADLTIGYDTGIR